MAGIRSAAGSPPRRLLGIIALFAAGFNPGSALAKSDGQVIAGITLAAVGGSAALVSNIGTLAYVSDLEYARGWGWLALLSGAATGTSGIILSRVEPDARVTGSLLIVFAAATIANGILGVSLPRATSPYHSHEPAVSFAPLLPTGSSDRGGISLHTRF